MDDLGGNTTIFGKHPYTGFAIITYIKQPLKKLEKPETITKGLASCQSLGARFSHVTRFLWWTPIWVFPKIGVSQNGWFIMENPIKMDALEVSLFSETSIYKIIISIHRLLPSNPFAWVDLMDTATRHPVRPRYQEGHLRIAQVGWTSVDFKNSWQYDLKAWNFPTPQMFLSKCCHQTSYVFFWILGGGEG